MLFWLWFRFGQTVTMSDEVASVTQVIIYQMMTDLTQRIESILLEYTLSLRGAQRVMTLSSPHSTPSASVTRDILYTRCCSCSYDTPREQPRHHRQCTRHFSNLGTFPSKVLETLQTIGFFAPLPPRPLPDPIPTQF